MWTHFWDMHSGSGTKEPFEHIYIEADEADAKVIFYNRFGHSPDRVSCTCCGLDYYVDTDTIEKVTKHHRGGLSVESYKQQPAVLFIPKDDIKPEDRVGKLPQQGYIWID